MSFDSSRFPFDPWNDFNGVVMQQGRVQLDSDWNEWLAELARRIRAGTMDTVGRAVYPATTPNAFLITAVPGSVTIGVGRMYVDGLLVENHGLPAPESGGWVPPNPGAPGPQPAWDPALDELVGTNPIDYTQQPYFPGVATVAPFPTTGGPFLVYLDVWERELTFLEYPDLVEKAVGIDTTGRIQTVWQVRLLDVSSVGNVTCTTSDSDIPPWDALIQSSAGRLTTGVVQSAPSGPCCLAPNTGFTGQENQLYRVEIHQPGTASSNPTGTFKWSRDNASVATAVTGIAQAGTVLTVQSTGKDNVLRFSPNDWVEITDDWLELNGQHGELHQVSLVNDGANTITLSTAVSAASFPVDANGNTDPTRHTRLVRWDQGSKVFEADGTTVWVDLNAVGSTGDIPIPPPGTSLILENGITISFDLNPATGAFKIGDYWTFAARTADGTVEKLVEAPPRGIHHHHARLAILPLGGTPTDCRVEWPPVSGGAGCDCAACVTAASHNGGTLTIQQAIDTVLTQGGGKVCLGPGIYNIAQTLTIGNPQQVAQNLVIAGHGLPTLVPAQTFNGNSIMSIDSSINIAVEDVAFAGGAGSVNAAGLASAVAGIIVQRSAYVRVERCSFGLLTDSAPLSPAIGVDGVPVLNFTLRGNLFNNVSVALALASTQDLCFLTQALIEDNQMYCINGAVFLSRFSGLSFSEIRFAKNFVQSTSGFVLQGNGLDVAIEENTFVIAAATTSDTLPYDAAILCNGSQTRIANNQISGITASLAVVDLGVGGPLSAGTYIWAVTAVNAAGRQILVTAPATLAFTDPEHRVSLEWNTAANAASYNLYRTVANGLDMRLDSNIPQGTGPTITFNDVLGDQQLGQNPPMPTLQNDGIVLGVPAATITSTMYGTQITGNRISALTGTGMLILVRALMLETIISQNQLLALGGSGIVFNGNAIDLDISENSIAFAEQVVSGKKGLLGISMRAVINVNVTENRIENLGPGVDVQGISRRAFVVLAAITLRLVGNRIVDIGPASALSFGILAQAVLGRMDIVDNEVRRASTVPTQPDASEFVALGAAGQVVNVSGNLLESFGGIGLTAAPTASLVAIDSCIFADNQCFLDNPPASSPVLVVGITSSQTIIASSNRVRGPRGAFGGGFHPSMVLAIPVNTDTPPFTVLGNITSSGIGFTSGGPISGLPNPWAPLNINVP